MYNQWGVALATEEKRRLERERRRERRRIRKERRIQRELEKEVMRSKQLVETELLRKRNTKGGSNKQPSSVQSASQRTKSDPKNPLSPKRGDDRKKSLLGRPVKQEPIASGNVEFSPSETTDTLLGRRGVIRSLSAKSGGHNGTSDSNISPKRERLSMQSTAPGSSGGKKPRPIKLLHRLGRHRRPASDVKLNQLEDVSDEPLGGGSEKGSPTKKARESVVGLSMSPSMPMLALMPDDTKGPDSQSKQGTDGRGGEDTEQKQPHVVIEMPPDDQMTLDDDGEVAKVGGDEELGETSSVNHGSDAGLMI